MNDPPCRARRTGDKQRHGGPARSGLPKSVLINRGRRRPRGLLTGWCGNFGVICEARVVAAGYGLSGEITAGNVGVLWFGPDEGSFLHGSIKNLPCAEKLYY